MTLTPYNISDGARQTSRRSGFDIDNPDQRYPVQNLQMEKVLAERGQQLDPRAHLLLRGKGAITRIFGRGRTS